MVLRQTCQLFCSILLVVRNQQASNFSRNRNHFFNQTTRTTLMTPDPSMKDRISSDVPMGIRRRAYPSPLTGPSPSCSHASCEASTYSCSKRLRITMLQADDSSYNSNSVITQSGRDIGFGFFVNFFVKAFRDDFFVKPFFLVFLYSRC
jgi:hypothetical protein